jgi:hypothetical protein
LDRAQRIYNANYRFTPDGSTATLASRIAVDASSEHVLLRWRLGQDGMARLERSTSGAGWIEVGQSRSDAPATSRSRIATSKPAATMGIG